MIKKLKELILLVVLTLLLVLLNNKVHASTISGHYTYENNSNGTIVITKYDGTAANNLLIPKQIDGKTVSKIGTSAFENCVNLTGDLIIPNSVESIGDFAFSGCSGLTGVLRIPDGVTSIGVGAFYMCSNLSGDLIIPNSVTNIGDLAFCECKGFTGNLILSNGITNIGVGAFYMCSNLTGDLIIPSNLITIKESTFEGCTGLTGSVIIPNSITSIEDYAFSKCNNLDNIIFYGSAPKISENTFDNYLKKIYYKKGTLGFSGEHWPELQVEEYCIDAGINGEKLPLSFPDVSKDSWYYDSVVYAYYNEIITGYGNGTFGPNDYLTRGMIATILYRLEGSPKVTVNNIFPDVPSDQWYADAVQWAYDTGVVTGYITLGTFGPNDNIKREDLALMLMRYAKYKGKYDSSSLKSLESYKDYKTVNEYAVEGMKWAVGNGIITGNNNSTTLDPGNSATRAEAVTMIMRYCKNIFKWN